MYSFPILSILITPNKNFNISATSSSFSCLFLVIYNQKKYGPTKELMTSNL